MATTRATTHQAPFWMMKTMKTIKLMIRRTTTTAWMIKKIKTNNGLYLISPFIINFPINLPPLVGSDDEQDASDDLSDSNSSGGAQNAHNYGNYSDN